MRYLPHSIFLSLAVVGIFACTTPEKSRPNILIIVADDLGYADLGCYGGDISTPNIDALAAKGIRFTQFHTALMCAPTRAMLLSGNNNHVAGMGIQGGSTPGTWQEGTPGYEGYLSDRIVPMPLLLREAGYHTYTAGKWHLGTKDENSPAQKGFERSFNLLQGGSNHYNSIGLHRSDSISFYSADGKRAKYPEGAYSTEFYTDRLIEFIKGSKDGKPFFAFAAYTSPHWPLQSPPEFDRYRGKYDMGYDSLRVLRFESLKATGIIPKNSRLPSQLETLKPWEKLTPEEKKIESRKMELYAAMVDNLDFHVGRLVDFLKKEGLYENTLIVFMSDNGAAAEDFYYTQPYAEFIQGHYDNRYENMGQPTSFVSYGPPWAKAGAAPFNRHKSYTTEGGITAPMIISGKGITASGDIRDEFISVMDLAPTFLEMAGVKYPGDHEKDKFKPMLGESLVSYLSGRTTNVHDTTYVMGMEHRGRAYFRKANWKIVNLEGPHVEETFKLYDLRNDPGETSDLAGSKPEKLKELLALWKQYRTDHGIIVAAPDR